MPASEDHLEHGSFQAGEEIRPLASSRAKTHSLFRSKLSAPAHRPRTASACASCQFSPMFFEDGSARTNDKNAERAPKPLWGNGLFMPSRPRSKIDRNDENPVTSAVAGTNGSFCPFVRFCPNPGSAKISRRKPLFFPSETLPWLRRWHFCHFVPHPLGEKFFDRGQHVQVLAVPACRLP